jgi:hypothetical protein
MKNRMPDEPMMLTNQAYFDGLKKEYDLKLLPDETVDGKATWVIEAKAKQSIPGGPATLVSYFDKSNGMNIKIVGKDPGGKTVLTATTSDIKINPPLKPERFVFKAPEGVEVMDLTKQGEPAAETKPGAEPAEKKEGEKKPEDAPKKPDKPKKPELPKLPKKP